jgi:ATP-dependent metalloprotease
LTEILSSNYHLRFAEAAKDRAPCVIFIDEIDSVGAKRTTSVLHPYANQTINQLLTEMDGFHQNEGVIVLGATNRRDDLDKALLRPGRFDMEVQVPTPDYTGRKEILDHYLTKVKLTCTFCTRASVFVPR